MTSLGPARQRVEAPGGSSQGSDGDGSDDGPAAKKPRPAAFSPEPAVAEMMDADRENRQLWDECRRSLADGKLVRKTGSSGTNVADRWVTGNW